MYRIVLACRGIRDEDAATVVADVAEEFAERPWQLNVACWWDAGVLRLRAENDFDPDGKATQDEFRDAVCTNVPLAEGQEISFAVDDVRSIDQVRTAHPTTPGG
jgi:hypothetical protein